MQKTSNTKPNILPAINTSTSRFPKVLSKYSMAIAMAHTKFVNKPQGFRWQTNHFCRSFFWPLAASTFYRSLSKMSYQSHWLALKGGRGIGCRDCLSKKGHRLLWHLAWRRRTLFFRYEDCIYRFSVLLSRLRIMAGLSFLNFWRCSFLYEFVDALFLSAIRKMSSAFFIQFRKCLFANELGYREMLKLLLAVTSFIISNRELRKYFIGNQDLYLDWLKGLWQCVLIIDRVNELLL